MPPKTGATVQDRGPAAVTADAETPEDPWALVASARNDLLNMGSSHPGADVAGPRRKLDRALAARPK